MDAPPRASARGGNINSPLVFFHPLPWLRARVHALTARAGHRPGISRSRPLTVCLTERQRMRRGRLQREEARSPLQGVAEATTRVSQVERRVLHLSNPGGETDWRHAWVRSEASVVDPSLGSLLVLPTQNYGCSEDATEKNSNRTGQITSGCISVTS